LKKLINFEIIKKMHRKNIFLRNIGYIIFSFFIVALLLAIGIYLGYTNRPEVDKVTSVINKDATMEFSADFNTFWKVWNVLNEKSIYAGDTDDQDKVWGAISGLASSFGDPYTTFFPPEENDTFREEIRGTFEGIGAEIGVKDDALTIVAPLKDTPAWNSGLKSGDKIIQIDDVNAIGLTSEEAINLIRGPEGTPVNLMIKREGESEPQTITVTRREIQIPTIETDIKQDEVFVISFYSFSENSVSLFRDALIEFIRSKKDKLIIDLRGNPGGYLEAAVNIASWFIDEGEIVLKETFAGASKPKLYRSRGPRLFNDNLSLVVLIDGGSASASEILAGALKEHGLATLIGMQTFGKGSVQELVKITDETALKVTVANWLTPNGLSISEGGLTPDIEVPYTIKDAELNLDPQMDKAIEFLLSK